MSLIHTCGRVLATAFMLTVTSPIFAAEGDAWSISKSSGEVWISSGGVQQASLKADDNLNPGDTIRTGRNGRVLLVRGEEHIMIAPNSVVGMPRKPEEGLITTIVQKAGSILLEVEKRNVKHFEVETPYLAAVVKGTQFRVSINATSTSVAVIRGQVEVTDFKSGQIARVMPGQNAIAFEHGKPGLSLGGAGTFNPIEQGQPRSSSLNRVPVPRAGLSAPRNAVNMHPIRTFAAIDRSGGKPSATSQPQRHSAGTLHNGLRISSTLGEVKLNFHKITHGLARGTTTTANGSSRNTVSNTVWSSSGPSSTTPTNTNASNANEMGSTSIIAGNPGMNGAGNVSPVAAGTNSGMGNGGNGNAKGNGHANGNANGNGHGNGNGDDDGNGNEGNGNGHGKGHGKK